MLQVERQFSRRYDTSKNVYPYSLCITRGSLGKKRKKARSDGVVWSGCTKNKQRSLLQASLKMTSSSIKQNLKYFHKLPLITFSCYSGVRAVHIYLQPRAEKIQGIYENLNKMLVPVLTHIGTRVNDRFTVHLEKDDVTLQVCIIISINFVD